jgi:predicted ATPase
MRDLSRPEQIFQLRSPNLDSDFPPLRSLDCQPHNLPVQLTSFVGRESAILEVGELLARNRIVTLTGAGGCGKTRLGLHVAAEAIGIGHSEGWLVDLSALTDPDLVPAAVMAAIGIREVPNQSDIATLTDRLHDRDVLVLLDNCEHVLAAASALTEALASNCAQIAVLATSREPLGVSGEVVWRVPSLSMPNEQDPVNIESLDTCEAVRLFIDRARNAQPNFTITNDNAPAVAAICQRLDGIPLAIELAAARVRMMSVERIAEALADRFHLLAGGTRRSLPRQQTLRASVDWSYEMLPEAERALLRRLSVFFGGMTLDAVESVGAAEEADRYEVLGLLSALVDKSLVHVNDTGDRYRLLETIKAYAEEELTAAGEEAVTRSRHLSFFAEMSEGAEKGLWSSQTPSWLAVLDIEHDNV